MGAGSKPAPEQEVRNEQREDDVEGLREHEGESGTAPIELTKSARRASRPMDTKASANHAVRRAFKRGMTSCLVPGVIKKERRARTTMNPSTNLGKRCQITPAVGRSPPDRPLRTVHQMAKANAASPSQDVLGELDDGADLGGDRPNQLARGG